MNFAVPKLRQNTNQIGKLINTKEATTYLGNGWGGTATKFSGQGASAMYYNGNIIQVLLRL